MAAFISTWAGRLKKMRPGEGIGDEPRSGIWHQHCRIGLHMEGNASAGAFINQGSIFVHPPKV